MAVLVAFLPGTVTALVGFLPAAYVAGVWGRRFSYHPLLASIGYSIFLFALWLAAGTSGLVATYKLIPGFDAHGAPLAFIPPYVVISIPGALVLIMWFVSTVRKATEQ